MRELPGELHRRADDDDVERDEQLVPERADPGGDAREREERPPRIPAERDREDRAGDERAEPSEHGLAPLRRRECGREHARAERREAEPGEPVAPRPRDEQ